MQQRCYQVLSSATKFVSWKACYRLRAANTKHEHKQIAGSKHQEYKLTQIDMYQQREPCKGHHACAEQWTMNLQTIPQLELNNAFQNKLISEKHKTYTEELLFGNLEIWVSVWP
jgi:hypothetical protein